MSSYIRQISHTWDTFAPKSFVWQRFKMRVSRCLCPRKEQTRWWLWWWWWWWSSLMVMPVSLPQKGSGQLPAAPLPPHKSSRHFSRGQRLESNAGYHFDETLTAIHVNCESFFTCSSNFAAHLIGFTSSTCQWNMLYPHPHGIPTPTWYTHTHMVYPLFVCHSLSGFNWTYSLRSCLPLML